MLEYFVGFNGGKRVCLEGEKAEHMEIYLFFQNLLT